MTVYSFPRKETKKETKEYQFPGFIQLSLNTPEGDINLFGASFPIDKLMQNKRKTDSVSNKYVNTLLAVIAREYDKALEEGEVVLNEVEAKILNSLQLKIVPTLESSNNDLEILEDLM